MSATRPPVRPPRPPLTITFASASDTPPLLGATWPETWTPSTEVLGSTSGGAGPATAGTARRAPGFCSRGQCRPAPPNTPPPHPHLPNRAVLSVRGPTPLYSPLTPTPPD